MELIGSIMVLFIKVILKMDKFVVKVIFNLKMETFLVVILKMEKLKILERYKLGIVDMKEVLNKIN